MSYSLGTRLGDAADTYFSGALDSNGELRLALSHANLLKLKAAYFVTAAVETVLYRKEPSNTSELVIGAGDGGTESTGLIIGGFYA